MMLWDQLLITTIHNSSSSSSLSLHVFALWHRCTMRRRIMLPTTALLLLLLRAILSTTSQPITTPTREGRTPLLMIIKGCQMGKACKGLRLAGRRRRRRDDCRILLLCFLWEYTKGAGGGSSHVIYL